MFTGDLNFNFYNSFYHIIIFLFLFVFFSYQYIGDLFLWSTKALSYMLVIFSLSLSFAILKFKLIFLVAYVLNDSEFKKYKNVFSEQLLSHSCHWILRFYFYYIFMHILRFSIIMQIHCMYFMHLHAACIYTHTYKYIYICAYKCSLFSHCFPCFCVFYLMEYLGHYFISKDKMSFHSFLQLHSVVLYGCMIIYHI